MANKLPWFTHDHDAHKDPEIRALIKAEGHAAHTIYWTLLECLHWHGKGDKLVMSLNDFAHDSLTTTIKVRVVLTLLERMGKVVGRWSGDTLEIEIKKFRERQSNLKIKTISKPLQDHFKTTIEREGERERENNLARKAAPRKKDVVLSKPKNPTPEQIIIRYFKEAKGVNADDKEWDRRHIDGRLIKEARALLRAFDGDVKNAGEYMLIKAAEWEHLPDWKMPGITSAAAADPRLNREKNNEPKSGAVDAARVDGQGRGGVTSPARDIVGDALRGLEPKGLRTEGVPILDGPRADQIDDDAFEP